MPDKQQILDCIRAIARQLGRTPSHSEFVRRAGMTKYSVSQFFAKWNDAVRAAGLEPRRLKVRPEDSELLRDWGETVRRKRALLSRRGYLLEGKHDPRTLERRFGPWSILPDAFRKFAERKREWAEVVALLPVREPKEGHAPQPNHPTPGAPT